MLSLEYTSKFHRDMKRMEKRGKNKKKITDIIYFLITKQKIPEHHRNHNPGVVGSSPTAAKMLKPLIYS